jgi:tRNA A37 threonylcarbamoyladenosine modification protein TsaB
MRVLAIDTALEACSVAVLDTERMNRLQCTADMPKP